MRRLLDMPVVLRLPFVESLLIVAVDPLFVVPLFMLPAVPLVPLFMVPVVPVVPVVPCCVMVPLLLVPIVPVVPVVPCAFRGRCAPVVVWLPPGVAVWALGVVLPDALVCAKAKPNDPATARAAAPAMMCLVNFMMFIPES